MYHYAPTTHDVKYGQTSDYTLYRQTCRCPSVVRRLNKLWPTFFIQLF